MYIFKIIFLNFLKYYYKSAQSESKINRIFFFFILFLLNTCLKNVISKYMYTIILKFIFLFFLIVRASFLLYENDYIYSSVHRKSSAHGV